MHITSRIKALWGKFGPAPAVAGRTWRPPWLAKSLRLHTEASIHPHDPAERAELFLSYNQGTTEIEVLNWLYATVLLLKPEHILETGTFDGFGTEALASACAANGFGRVHAVELDATVSARARVRHQKAGLARWVEYHTLDSLQYLATTDVRFQLGFFDSDCAIRAEEYRVCCERGLLHGPAVFHDTSPYRARTMPDYPPAEQHRAFRAKIREYAARFGDNGVFESTLSRGLIVVYPTVAN